MLPRLPDGHPRRRGAPQEIDIFQCQPMRLVDQLGEPPLQTAPRPGAPAPARLARHTRGAVRAAQPARACPPLSGGACGPPRRTPPGRARRTLRASALESRRRTRYAASPVCRGAVWLARVIAISHSTAGSTSARIASVGGARLRICQRVGACDEPERVEVLVGADQFGDTVVLHSRSVNSIAWIDSSRAMDLEQIDR
jgi:hypothetical protein